MTATKGRTNKRKDTPMATAPVTAGESTLETRGAAKQVMSRLLATALLGDFAREQPSPATMEDWLEAKAHIYLQPSTAAQAKEAIQQCRIAVETQFRKLDSGIKRHSFEIAQEVARATEATLAKAMRRISEALDATDDVVQMDNETGISIVVGRTPNHKVRLQAAKEILLINGAYAPSKIESKVEVGDRLAALTTAQLQLELEQLQQRARLIAGADPTQIIDITTEDNQPAAI